MIRLIPVPDSYQIFLAHERWPQGHWRLWIPELIILDRDEERLEAQSPARWERVGEGWRLTGETAPGVRAATFEVVFLPREDACAMTLTLRNTGTQAWGDYANFACCLSSRHAEHFADPNGERTWLATESGTTNMSALLPGCSCEEHHHFPIGARHDTSDGLQRTTASSGWIARQAENGADYMLFAWERSARLDVNFNVLTCIHAHPAIGPLAPGESVTVRGAIGWGQASPEAYGAQAQALLEQI